MNDTHTLSLLFTVVSFFDSRRLFKLKCFAGFFRIKVVGMGVWGVGRSLREGEAALL